MEERKISTFGVFGWYNLGNNCTLEAFLDNAHKFAPGAKLSCICPNPARITDVYHIPAFPISRTPGKAWHLNKNRSLIVLSKVLNRGIAEPIVWTKAYKYLRDSDLLVMTGTGMLDDGSLGPFRMPYDLFRWSVLARLSNTKLHFVSVGAGPILHPLSKWFIRRALGLANYRSYRDIFSRNYLQSIGFDAKQDPVFPDLAFSLPETIFPEPSIHDMSKPIVGLGLMSYFWNFPGLGEDIYQTYITKITTFLEWLFARNYSVRLLVGDPYLDDRAIQDVQTTLYKRGIKRGDNQLIAESVSSFKDLIHQLANTDLIIATRFHNVILALMSNKPVISISYHQKVDALMKEFGLENYCQSIEDLDIDRLIGQFNELESNSGQIKRSILIKVEQYRRELDEQYVDLFNLF
jgi:polysaccharide pyruvyl transferase WcaK-like protein